MTGQDILFQDMFGRVAAFGVKYAAIFPSDSLAGQAFTGVGTEHGKLARQFAFQVTGRGGIRLGASSKAASRKAVRRDINMILRTVAAMDLDTPGIKEKFVMPQGSNDQKLLSTARAFEELIAPLKDPMLAHDVKPEFFDRLPQDIAQFEAAIAEKNDGRNSHVTANAAVKAAMKRALEHISRLDACVPNRLEDDPVALEAWKEARRVKYPSRKPEAIAQPTVSPAAVEGDAAAV